jgi:ParB-like chromosome segregation protein Spo0J
MILKVDKEFQKLIRPLDKQEYARLEESIVQFGVLDTIKSWITENGDELIVDGHNRYEIARKHGKPFGCSRMSFSNRDQARMWILSNQLARRNMSASAYREMTIAVTALLTKIKAKTSRDEAIKNLNAPSHRNPVPRSETKKDTIREEAKAAGIPRERLAAAMKLPDETLEDVVQGKSSLPAAPDKKPSSRMAVGCLTELEVRQECRRWLLNLRQMADPIWGEMILENLEAYPPTPAQKRRLIDALDAAQKTIEEVRAAWEAEWDRQAATSRVQEASAEAATIQ